MRNDGCEVKKRSYVFELARAVILALAITLVLVLAAAFLIKALNVPTKAIAIINQAIKCVSIFVSALVCLRLKGCGFARGIILGILYVLLSYVVFSLINGSFSAGISLLNDVAFGAAAGFVGGVAASVIRK